MFQSSLTGVQGEAPTGVVGLATVENGIGVIGRADTGSLAYGVWGLSPSGYAGYFSGNVRVVGTLSKTAGSFKIDHPLDPANRYLSHSFVESPDMKNVYDGTVTLGDDGRATVTLPSYFEALNRDFRYQLTPIGKAVPLCIEQKIRDGMFVIGGGVPGLEVCWQVTGIRKDAYAAAHPIIVEEEKPAEEKGTFLSPKELGQPESKSVTARREAALSRSATPVEKKAPEAR